MSPSDLEVLIHCRVSPVDHPRDDAPAVRAAIDKFQRDGIISLKARAPQSGITNPYELTEKGDAFLDMILATPYPVIKYVDPRTP